MSVAAVVALSGCGSSSLVAQDAGSPSPSALLALRLHGGSVLPSPDPSEAVPTNSWEQFQTNVNPGSLISFGAANFGVRVVGVTHRVDKNLSAGVVGSNAWPGSQIQTSSDGGTTWTNATDVSGGVWSVNALDATHAWAVGVTSLLSTSDSGKTWTPLREPADHPLVTASFTQDLVGYGLDTEGDLFSTKDGGQTWQPAALPFKATALCFSTPKDGYVTDETGAIWATADSGAKWSAQQAAAFSKPDDQFTWSTLSCDSQTVVGSFSDQNPNNQGDVPFAVLAKSAGTSAFTPIAATGGQPVASPSPQAGAAGILRLGTAVAAGGGIVAAGWRSSGWALQSATFSRPGSASTTALTPGLKHADSEGSESAEDGLQIQGASFTDADHGWLLVEDDALGTDDAPEIATDVLSTSDGGATWTVASQGTASPVPQ